MRALGLLLLSACGRIGFSDIETGDAPLGDGQPGVDAATAYGAAVLAEGPLAYWRFDDTGTTAVDSAGTNDGQYLGGVTLDVAGAITGDPSTAIGVDGTTGQVEAADVLGFPATSPYSIELWLLEASSSRYQHYVTKQVRNATMPIHGYAIVQANNGIFAERWANSIKLAETPPVVPTLNTWSHFVMAYDGTAMVIYLDGTQRSSTPDTGVMPTYSAPLQLCSQPTGANYLGSLDEVAIYGHALSAQTVADHYRIGTTGS